MRLTVLTSALVLGLAAAAAAQTTTGFELSPIVRVDRLVLEAGAGGATPVTGVVATVPLARHYGIEGEITWAGRTIERSYQGTFISYVQSPNPTREEIERFAPIARRTLRYAPEAGWSIAFVAKGNVSPRVSVRVRGGASGRRFLETSDYAILSIPADVDPLRVARDFQSSSRHRLRGGLLAGFDMPIRVTPRLSVAPELRFVYGGPARVGDKYRELSVGARAIWQL